MRVGDDDDDDRAIERPGELVDRMRRAAERDGWTDAAGLIGRYWDQLAVAAPQELLDAIRALPTDVILEEPGFVAAANYLQQMMLDVDPSRFRHDGRLDHLADPDTSTPLIHRLILLTGQIASAQSAGQFERALALVDQAHRELAACPPEEEAKMRSTVPHLGLQWARAMSFGDAPGAVAEYERVYELAQVTKQLFLARRAAANLAWSHADQGHLPLAETWIARAEALEPNARYDAPVYLASALVKLDRNDYEGAAVDQARLSVVPEGDHWAAALWVAAMGARTAADAAPLHTTLSAEVNRHSRAERETPANLRYLHAARLRLSLLRPTATPVGPENPATSVEHLVVATEALHRRSYKLAATHGAHAVALTQTPRVLAGGLLVHAAALDGLKQTAHAADVSLEAQSVIDAGRLYSPYRLLPAGTLDRLARHLPTDVRERVLTIAHGKRSPELAALTTRQTEILRAIMSDRPLADVAASLYISPNTLKSALANIYGALGVKTRHEAADFARRAGLR